MAEVDGRFKAVGEVMAKYRTADGGFVSYEELSDADRTLLSGKANTLAGDLATLRGKLGLG